MPDAPMARSAAGTTWLRSSGLTVTGRCPRTRVHVVDHFTVRWACERHREALTRVAEAFGGGRVFVAVWFREDPHTDFSWPVSTERTLPGVCPVKREIREWLLTVEEFEEFYAQTVARLTGQL